jgi:mRNA interferase MazF
MITSAAHAPWPGDTPLTDLVSAGLPRPCLARLKIFTLDNRFILRRIGTLGAADRKRLGSELADHLVVTA